MCMSKHSPTPSAPSPLACGLACLADNQVDPDTMFGSVKADRRQVLNSVWELVRNQRDVAGVCYVNRFKLQLLELDTRIDAMGDMSNALSMP